MKTISQLRQKAFDYNTSIENTFFLFLDTETTGLRPRRGARITEIAVLSRNEILYQYNKPVSGTSELNEAEFEKLGYVLKKGVIVAHNFIFDLNFLAHEAFRHGLTLAPSLFVDTLTLAKSLLPELRSYQLGALLNHFDIQVNAPLHTAITDAQAVRALFWKLVAFGQLSNLRDAKVQQLNWSTY